MVADAAFPSSVELVLGSYVPLIAVRGASPIALEAAVSAMAPATRAAIAADLKCYLAWCGKRRPPVTAVRAAPETLVHRILGLGDQEPLPTQAGMVRDTLRGSAAPSGSASVRRPRFGSGRR